MSVSPNSFPATYSLEQYPLHITTNLDPTGASCVIYIAQTRSEHIGELVRVDDRWKCMTPPYLFVLGIVTVYLSLVRDGMSTIPHPVTAYRASVSP